MKPYLYKLIGRVFGRLGINARYHGAVISSDTISANPGILVPMMLGRFERTEWLLSKEADQNVDAIVDLGAGSGALSLAVSRNQGRDVAHVMVEANPDMIPLLSENLSLNQVEAKVVHGAIDYGTRDSIVLHKGCSFLKSSVFQRRDSMSVVEVPALSLSRVFEVGGLQGRERVFVMMDIEGSELDVIDQDVDLLCDRVSWLLVEFHPKTVGSSASEKAITSLEEVGFVVEKRVGSAIVFRNTRM